MNNTTAAVAEFKVKSGVYALVDPRSNRVMYCGVACDIEYRFRQHLDVERYDSNREKVRWIAGLKANGLSPRLVILDECTWPESDETERSRIRQYKLSGQCELNKASGGATSRGVPKPANSHQEDWFQLGRKIKEARLLLVEIFDEAGRLGGAKATEAPMLTVQSIDRTKLKLQGLLDRTFPEWNDFTATMFGSSEDWQS